MHKNISNTERNSSESFKILSPLAFLVENIHIANARTPFSSTTVRGAL